VDPLLRHYREIWLVDFEFGCQDGGRPEPRCVCARELRSGRLVRLWLGDGAPASPPYPTGSDVLFVAYYASAELGCHLTLDWPMPERDLDLFVEFRNATNGRPVPCGNGLLGALAYFGLDALAGAEKEEMRQLALRGGEYSDAEKAALLDYCMEDVNSLAQLLPAMLPLIGSDKGLGQALLRGRYMCTAARMEWTGTPIDVETLARLWDHWSAIKVKLVHEVNRDVGVYVPVNPKQPDGALKFSAEKFAEYLTRNSIAWPRLESGALALDDETFREMARTYPVEVGPLRELRHTLGQLRLNDLAVGPDGRNRCLLSCFRSRTGRNQPSNSRFIFGPSTWLRALIKPGPGRAIGYVDWSAQELGIAASLSGDRNMQAAYASGDPYLWFARFCGAVPTDATRTSHAADREKFKVTMLGTLYGLSEVGLALKLNVPTCRGRELLQLHKTVFREFWRWSDATQDRAILTGKLRTCFGWTLHVGPDVNPRSLRNFPVQAAGAEMMRLAACLATERGVMVCCPIHDAFLIEADVDAIDGEVARMRSCMEEASMVVLDGFALWTDFKITRFPDRFSDARGTQMWEVVCRLLDNLNGTGPDGAVRVGGCTTGGAPPASGMAQVSTTSGAPAQSYSPMS
jgi:hypothetical protein